MVKTSMGEELYCHCPLNVPDQKHYVMVSLHAHYRNGFLAYDGGIVDQPKFYLDAMNVVQEEINFHDK